MSFFTALTGLKGAQTDISTTSNNIANVGSTGFKGRAEFGDIFSTTPLQTNVVGSGAGTKSITQQFSQEILYNQLTRWTWQFRDKVFSL